MSDKIGIATVESVDISSTNRRFLDAVDHTIHASIEEVEALSTDLAGEIAKLIPLPDLIVGLANGALLPTRIVAESLTIPGHIVKVRRKGSRYKQRLARVAKALRIPPRAVLWGPLCRIWIVFQNQTSALEGGEDSFAFDAVGRHIVLVDDCVETGNSLRYVADRLYEAGAASVRTAVICWARMPNIPDHQSRPDIHLHRQIQFYPWSNNTTHVGAFDEWLRENDMELWK